MLACQHVEQAALDLRGIGHDYDVPRRCLHGLAERAGAREILPVQASPPPQRVVWAAQ